MTNNSASPHADSPTDHPSAARAYGYSLGSKDNYEVDREVARETLKQFPEGVDVARQNRLFLYRAVRYLAAEAGITQFLDLGSGLPTDNNVHQVAQVFAPDSRVVYVDNDPVVLAHGDALLVEDANTTVIGADMTHPRQVLDHSDTQRLIDFTRPLAVLMFSIPHNIPDDEDAQRAIHTPVAHAPPGSYLAISHMVSESAARAEQSNEHLNGLGLPWKTRTPEILDAWVADLHPVEPGLRDINDWRPDPDQPPLPPTPAELRPFEGASHLGKELFEYGGVLRKP